MQKRILERLMEEYHQLPPHSRFLHFHNNGIRETDTNGQLQRSFFALSLLIAARAQLIVSPIVMMVTASHNPPGYNGVKVEALKGELPFTSKEAQDTINYEDHFNKIALSLKSKNLDKSFYVFIGRDMRPTSLRLSTLISNTLQQLGAYVIDLGEGSTPQTFSMSSYIYHRLQKDTVSNPLVFKQDYFIQIERSFSSAIELISTQKDRQWLPKTICLDFANGAGAASFKHYGFLNRFFNIISLNNKDFQNPNVNCGADKIFKNKDNPEQFPKLPQAEQYYFFDGDSDRIIAKLHKEQQISDGDDFGACFSKLLVQLVNKSGLGDIKIGCVGNIVSNQGLNVYLASMGLKLERVPVGVINLAKAAQRYSVSTYFENNGHGCLYFSEEILTILNEISQKNWHAKLLLYLHQICRNNSRGYALHNMLVLQLYMHYYKTDTLTLFQKHYILEQNFQLSPDCHFKNQEQGNKLLSQPKEIVHFIETIQQKYPRCEITVRRSETSPKLRLSIQGAQKQCKAIFAQIEPAILSAIQHDSQSK